MDHGFWHERWAEGRTGWHRAEVNPRMPRYLGRLVDGRSSRVLVPLCGKSLDLSYLAAAGHEVVGVELVDQAARDFFSDHDMEMEERIEGAYRRYSSGPITIFQGDFLGVSPALIGPVDAVYDRASIIALPPEDRDRYAPRLLSLLSPGARILMITLAYDQSRLDGPPFSVPEDEVRARFGDACDLEVLDRAEVTPGDRFLEAGVETLREAVHLLTVRG